MTALAPAPVLAQPVYKMIAPGDRIPQMRQACGENPNFFFDVFAGRYHVLGFFLDYASAGTPALLQRLTARGDLFNDAHAAFTGVSVAPGDAARPEFATRPGVRFARDFDHAMSRACGIAPLEGPLEPGTPLRRALILVDPSLHVIETYPFTLEGVDALLAWLSQAPTPDRYGGLMRPAPILVLPNLFSPDLCKRLIAYYETQGGAESGVHRDNRPTLDPGFKRRKDCTVEDRRLLDDARWSIARRVLPEIRKIFYMDTRYIERFTVGCYAAEDGGHFSPHTDNNPGLTAHRRFALSVNLNDDFDGGEVVFPEYNMAGYKVPAGWAIVFPCGALHAVRRVTRGARYAFLPFLYDDGGQAIRQNELARQAERDAAASA